MLRQFVAGEGLTSKMMAFYLLARILGTCSTIPRLHFFDLYLEVEITSRTLISLFVPGSIHSGSSSRDDCGQMFPYESRVSSFPDRFQHYAWTKDFIRAESKLQSIS